ncbi:MAG TPA: carboxymuconolactone decarboxylase family protein [Acidobacteriaceae bacterium]|nr:carboxymuconolactone decarboxylase family protein [Acidobacteriaceae bacterium]
MAARLRYPEVAPEGYAALSAFGHYVNAATALEPVLLGMVYLRASVLNGCEFCTELHKSELRKHHEPESRIEAVSAGPDSEAFTPREQAALHWTDVLTKLHGGPASDEEYAAINRFFQGRDLVDLTFAIANINAWNRMGVAFRPEWRPRAAGGTVETAGPESSKAASLPGASAKPVSEPPAAVPAEAEDDGGKVASD